MNRGRTGSGDLPDDGRVFHRSGFFFTRSNGRTVPAGVQRTDATVLRRGRTACGPRAHARWRSGRCRGTFLNQGDDAVALVRLERTELILDIDSSLAAQREQILALHVQFARKREDANLVFLQAQLPVLFNLT
jgi:hypothetical protein